jgi:disease resistance protein RPM1
MALSRIAVAGLSPLFGVRSEIAATVQDLDLLRAFFRIVDARRGTDALAAAWVKQVRDTAFELEDVADECCYLSGHGRGWVNVRAWFALSRRLRKARERLRQLSAAREHYSIRQADGPPVPVATTSRFVAQTAHFLKEEEIVGFAEHEKQLMEWVAGDMEPRRTALVAVWGMGGVGKTTLVTRVYKEVPASHFECAAWVAVSQAFTLDDLLRKILKELSGDAPASSGRDADADYRSLVSAVHDILRQRRYLVVLDDVWDAELWNKLRHAFLDDENGSRVLITTRTRDVARAAAAERTMWLEPLEWRYAWNLFCNVAFWDVPGRTCPSYLEEFATDMLERCCGLPLAIVSIGNLLARKDRTEFEWEKTRDSLVWNESSDYLRIGEAASILNLSIDDLPHNIKRCFLSCSIYPEDFLLKRKIQIRMWVAQGFIEEKPGEHRTAEEIADDYLDQLVQRSLLQAVDRNEFGRPKSCVIHDLMRELIIHKSREQEGFADCKIAMNRNTRIRHLAVGMCEEVDSQHIQSLATLRSFIALGSKLDVSFLSHFRLLTALNLWFIEISKLPDSVTNLHNLRYLGIRSTPIEQLPKELGKLQKLQTLDAKWSMVRRLPSSAAKLKSLRHLIIFASANDGMHSPGIAVQVPDGLESLCSLQTLKYVRADNKMVRSLAKLEQMRSLELFDVNLSCIVDLSSSISRMSCLVRLGLRCEPGQDEALDLESICPPPLKLQKLSLNGSLARGKLPSWTRSLTSLVHLWLCDSGIAQDSLVVLAKLPRLVNVTLIAAYQGTSMIFPGGSFPALQRLILENIPNLSRIEFEEGCLQNLHHLVLIRCTRLTETPRGMDNLMHLQHLNLIGMPWHFEYNLKQQDGYAAYYKPDNSEFLRVHGPRQWRWIGPNKKEVADDDS